MKDVNIYTIKLSTEPEKPTFYILYVCATALIIIIIIMAEMAVV